jgi:hypothetical protein
MSEARAQWTPFATLELENRTGLKAHLLWEVENGL